MPRKTHDMMNRDGDVLLPSSRVRFQPIDARPSVDRQSTGGRMMAVNAMAIAI